MFFRLHEIVSWLGLTVFEICLNLACLLTFSIILPIKISNIFGEDTLDWFKVFMPLFIGDICNAYFCVIVAIRKYWENNNKKRAIQRLSWSTYFLVLMAIFKYMLCIKLSGPTSLEYSEVFAPVFVLLQLIAVRACQIPNNSNFNLQTN